MVLYMHFVLYLSNVDFALDLQKGFKEVEV